MSDYPVLDGIRLVVSAAAILLAVLVLRLAWARRGDWGEKPHWTTYVSYAASLFVCAALCIASLGHPLVWETWGAVLVITLGWYGVSAHVIFQRPKARR